MRAESCRSPVLNPGGTLYGNGVYLAEAVSKSDEYTTPHGEDLRSILICLTALGRVTQLKETTARHFSHEILHFKKSFNVSFFAFYLARDVSNESGANRCLAILFCEPVSGISHDSNASELLKAGR